VERAGEGQRKRTRAAAGLGAARGSCQSRRWRRQSGNGGEWRRPAAAEGQLGRVAEQRGVLGESQQEGLRRWASAGVMRGGQERQGEASGGEARRPATALLRGRGGAEEEEGGGALGAAVKFQKLQGPHCNIEFPTILKLK
jgi:hypothetical protein